MDGRQKLKLNDEKTETITFRSKNNLQRLPANSVTVGDNLIQASKPVRNLGFHLDETLSMDDHISKTKQKCFLNVRNIRKIRQYLDEETTKILVQAFVTSHLDYCNAMLYGMTKHQMKQLQRIQNSCARLIAQTNIRDHITPVLIDLHWLPLEHRATFKIATMVYKAIHGLAYIPRT